MENRLTISFNYQLEECNKHIRLEAVAELIASAFLFRIHSFRRQYDTPVIKETPSFILPPIEIRRVEKEGKQLWIHSDSEKESQLSSIIGKAIEETQTTGLEKTT